jgi:hypothetical protein
LAGDDGSPSGHAGLPLLNIVFVFATMTEALYRSRAGCLARCQKGRRAALHPFHIFTLPTD